MGKSLKGKELGTGISQRKDGLYTARYTNRQGDRNILKNCRSVDNGWQINSIKMNTIVLKLAKI